MKQSLLGMALLGSMVGLGVPVVANSGWLLIAPPEFQGREGGTRFVVDVPLEHWRQVEAFDTARACERSKDEHRSHALQQVNVRMPYPPYPQPPEVKDLPTGHVAPTEKPSRLKTDEEPSAGRRYGLTDIIDDIVGKRNRAEEMMTEEQRQRLELAREEWRREAQKIEALRQPERQAVNERFLLWKCVPADAVYRGAR